MTQANGTRRLSGRGARRRAKIAIVPAAATSVATGPASETRRPNRFSSKTRRRNDARPVAGERRARSRRRRGVGRGRTRSRAPLLALRAARNPSALVAEDGRRRQPAGLLERAEHLEIVACRGRVAVDDEDGRSEEGSARQQGTVPKSTDHVRTHSRRGLSISRMYRAAARMDWPAVSRAALGG